MFRILVKSSAKIFLILCLLQISACTGQKSAGYGTVGKAMQRILPGQETVETELNDFAGQGIMGQVLRHITSEMLSVWERTESLLDNEMWKDFLIKVYEIEKGEDPITDSTENTMLVDESQTEKLFDAYEIEEKVYIVQEEHVDIEIYYPQLHGFKDSKKEKKINRLIESEAKRLIPDDMSSPKDGWEDIDYVECVYLHYEIKFLNRDFVSILYQGMDGWMVPGHGLDKTAVATNIDLKAIKTVSLEDIITDMNALCTLLLEDKFENISRWENLPSDYTISREYTGQGAFDELLDALYGRQYRRMEWYIEDSDLIFVSVRNTSYEEYSADINTLQGLINEKFLEMLRIDE